MKHVVVLMGGISAEREISLKSGRAVAEALRTRNFKVTELDITSREFELPPDTDMVFVALHGTYGEDGDVQKFLHKMGVPYSGSDEKSSRISFDKMLSKKCFEKHGVNTPRYEVLRNGQPRTLPLPVVVKPPRQGSSIGLTIVKDESEWPVALETSLKYDEEVLVEAFVSGRELTVGIVGQEVYPVVEIRAPGGHYDYRAKYTTGTTEYLCPAPLEEEVARECQHLAWKTFQALGARGLGRVDIRLTGDNIPYVLELNSIPGFTSTSLLPKAARAAGIEFPELCEKIVMLTLQDMQ
ncbi:MAG TPA: D-alanine--D-alanine ligase [Kiritimatiellia bacterium]|nr:D-alanine--D-alanine ligase [Kiritimatiellia bacterium]